MKKHITKEQWDELSYIEKLNFHKVFGGFNDDFYEKIKRDKQEEEHIKQWELTGAIKLPNIGQLIEFLGDDLMEIHLSQITKGKYCVALVGRNGENIPLFENEELIDTLWEAVKYKIIKSI